jgi:hypothetical protein
MADSQTYHDDSSAGGAGGFDREHRNPRYRGLYASGRPATLGVADRGALFHGLASDLPTLYPEDLQVAVSRRESLIEAIEAFRRKRRRLSSRDLNRMGLMDRELSTIERRLTLHAKRVRGSSLELAKDAGKGWEAYLKCLVFLVFFLEKSQEGIGSLLRVVKDPGKSSRAIVRGLEENLSRVLDGTRGLAAQIPPPPSLDGRPLVRAVPLLGPLPLKKTLKKLTVAAEQTLEALEEARLTALDALLLAEARVASLGLHAATSGPEATFVPEGDIPGGAPEIPQAPRVAGLPPIPMALEGKIEPAETPRRSPLRVLAAITAGLSLALLAVFLKAHFLDAPEDARFFIFNGLGTTVTVNFPGTEAVLAPGDKLANSVRLGEPFSIETYINGGLAERLSATAPSDPAESLVYSVMGAAPFIEWTAHYGPRPEGSLEESDKSLGAPKLFSTRAEFVLSMPPDKIRIRTESASILTLNPLARVHPELMLQSLPQDSWRTMVEAQARWNDPGDLFLPLWLTYLTQLSHQNALEVLEDRLGDYPEDIWTIRALLATYPPDRRAELCGALTEDSLSFPDDPDKAYLMIRCVGSREQRARGYLDLLDRFPDNPFLNRAAGFYYFDQGAYPASFQYLKKAFLLEPRVMLADMDFLARLSNHQGESAAVISSEIGPWSPHIRRLLSIDGAPDGEFMASTEDALRHLEAGDPETALETAVPPVSTYILYLCAASDGAPQGIVERALEADTLANLTVNNAWAALGLFLREGKDAEVIEGFILDNASDRNLALSALHIVQNRDLDSLDSFMLGQDPWFQGMLALAAHVSLGEDAPTRYQDIARGFLFVGERPYLR